MFTAEEIIHFWFVECKPEDWWSRNADFDARLAERFADTHERVAKAEAFTWRNNAQGRLAEIIVLDQFSRQIHRGTAKAFASDPMALVLAQEMVAQGFDRQLPQGQRTFAYMPYMHSESLVVHEEAMRLFKALGLKEQIDYEIMHKDLIARFGRYPKRNAALGRVSTPEELAYIAEDKARDF